jgi:HSP20 family protein
MEDNYMFSSRNYRLFPLSQALLGDVFSTSQSIPFSASNKDFPIEVITGPTYFKVRAVVAGVDSEQIQINIDDRVLTITADIKDQNQLKDDEQVYTNEIEYGHYSRQIKFESSLDEENVKAELKDGILELYIPKAAPKSGKTIKINKKEEG